MMSWSNIGSFTANENLSKATQAEIMCMDMEITLHWVIFIYVVSYSNKVAASSN